jgi:HEAT repeat protein
MHLVTRRLFSMLGFAILLCARVALGQEMSADEAWEALPRYEYGQDMAPLLRIDRIVNESMRDVELRAECAAKMATLLMREETTPAACQYIYLQLRQVGTDAEVPILSDLLMRTETSDDARAALEAMRSEASTTALREGLSVLDGSSLVGVINSLGAIRDEESLLALARLFESEDKKLVEATVNAVGLIGGVQATELLITELETTEPRTSHTLMVALLRCAGSERGAGRLETAERIYGRLSQTEYPSGIRCAALTGLLQLEGEEKEATIVEWLRDPDLERRRIALGNITFISEERLQFLLENWTDLPPDVQAVVMESATPEEVDDAISTALSLIESNELLQQLRGISGLKRSGDVSTIPVLIDLLTARGEVSDAAKDALFAMPRKDVETALLTALNDRLELRTTVIDLLVAIKSYDAIDPLIELAFQADPTIHGPALDGLRGISDPDQHDMPRLFTLLLRTTPGLHRDEVERTIVIVVLKQPDDALRESMIFNVIKNIDSSKHPECLPVLGRLGGTYSMELIETYLDDENPMHRDSAVRALCNWPDVEAADQLLELASSSENREYQRWGLRAYIRVVTLPNERSESETLQMLQQAFHLSKTPDDKCLAIDRASNVRTMEAVRWIASHLLEEELCETACESLVELAHHRFLRQPNMDEFGPILDEVVRLSENQEMADRAKRYRLGL